MMNERTRWPIRQIRERFYVLEDPHGRRISWHRTETGALRKRREIIELRELTAERLGLTC